MNAEGEDAGERFDGPCVLCGETVRGRPYAALGLFAVITSAGDGMHFEPDEDAATVAGWRDVALTRVVHVDTCLQAYFEGVVAEALHHRRQTDEGGQ